MGYANWSSTIKQLSPLTGDFSYGSIRSVLAQYSIIEMPDIPVTKDAQLQGL